MVEIKVPRTQIENGAFEKTARKFGISCQGLPSAKELKNSIEREFIITITGINGNVHAFLSNAVNEETMTFKRECVRICL